MTLRTTCALLASALFLCGPAAAHDDRIIRADGHAPIGVMGDHLHDAGEVMISYRFMRMDMAGNRIGTDSISPEEIATSVPNRFFGQPMQPPTLRVVPTEMTMDMHMIGAMYAPSDDITLMAMGSLISKDMDHITFQGPTGTARLGTFTTGATGVGDTKLSALVRLHEGETHHLHLNAGVSLPTGAIDKTDRILTPLGTRPEVRLPYAMQLGSGTVDLLPGMTYTGQADAFGWGAQARGTIRLGENAEGYSLGHGGALTAWASWMPRPWISVSGRIEGRTLGRIDGRDTRIAGPVQTADPDNYGGETIDLFAGVNLAGQSGLLRGHRLALEVGMPVYRDLNGPQMETDWTLTLGYQVAF